MPLPTQWATPEDFATLFQYLWSRSFPVDEHSIAARRADWTMHIGVVIRDIGDLMGLRTRFERGGRVDAVLRSYEGDAIAIEWEWEGVRGSELGKLKTYRPWNRPGVTARLPHYCVLISYASHTSNL